MFRAIARYIVLLSLSSRPSSASPRRESAGAEEPYETHRAHAPAALFSEPLPFLRRPDPTIPLHNISFNPVTINPVHQIQNLFH